MQIWSSLERRNWGTIDMQKAKALPREMRILQKRSYWRIYEIRKRPSTVQRMKLLGTMNNTTDEIMKRWAMQSFPCDKAQFNFFFFFFSLISVCTKNSIKMCLGISNGFRNFWALNLSWFLLSIVVIKSPWSGVWGNDKPAIHGVWCSLYFIFHIFSVEEDVPRGGKTQVTKGVK